MGVSRGEGSADGLGRLALFFGEAGTAVADGFRDGAAAEAEVLELAVAIGLQLGDGGAVVGFRRRAAEMEAAGRLFRGAPRPGADAGFDQVAREPGIGQEAGVELEQVVPQARTLDPGEKIRYQRHGLNSL